MRHKCIRRTAPVAVQPGMFAERAGGVDQQTAAGTLDADGAKQTVVIFKIKSLAGFVGGKHIVK